jgi:hypothetical protein
VKIETAIHKILASDGSTKLKFLKMGNLALRQFPSSPNQKLAQAAASELRAALMQEGIGL